MRPVPPQTQAGRARAAAAPGDPASGEGGFLGEVASARRLAGHLAAMVQDAQRQVGKSFQLQITVNSDVIQDLCGACASARGALSGAVQRAVSGSSGGEAEALEGVPLSDVFALIDEVDADDGIHELFETCFPTTMRAVRDVAPRGNEPW